MHSLRALVALLRGLFRRNVVADEICDELQFHLQARAEQYEREGLNPADAARKARHRVGSLPLYQDQGYNVRGSGALETVVQDVRFGVRLLGRRRGFTLVAVLTLALGIGLNTAVFTVVDDILFRPMPVRDPGSLAAVFTSEEHGDPNGTTSWADFQDIRDSNAVFGDLIGHSLMMAAFGAEGHNRLLIGEVVTTNYFDALGVPLSLGRGFRPEEEVGEGQHPVAILGYRLWQSRFGGRPDVLGESVVLHNRAYTIVGVAPDGFSGLTPGLDAELWIPMSMVADTEPLTLNDVHPSPGETRLERRGHRWLFVLGRLRPGITVEAAEANLDAIMAGLAEVYPGSNETRSARVLPASSIRIHPLIDNALRPSGLVLLAAVGLVLLVACGNLASMLLARGVSRARELAMRSALGANRRRLVRQLLVENLILALAGGGAGLIVGSLALRWLVSIELPFDLSVPMSFGIDLRVLTFAFALSLLTGLAFGLLPALGASRTDLVGVIKTEASPSGSRRRFGLGQGLVVGQVAVSLVLIVGGLLLGRSVLAAQTIDPGFDPSRVAVVSINLGFHGYSDERAARFFEQALGRIEGLPGLEAVGLSERIPFSPNVHQSTIVVDGRPDATPPGGLTIDNTRVSPAYFDAIGVPIIEGRNFDTRDTLESIDTAVVNQTLARLLWPDDSAVGKRLRFRDQSGPPIEVVGVVPDHKVRTLGETPRPFIHYARSQGDAVWGTFVARTSGDPAVAARAIGTEILALDPNVVLMEAQPYDRVITLSLLPVRLGATLIGSLAALAMLLAGLGLYGVIAFGVSRRTREIGIRMALGADGRRVLGQVVREGLVLVTIGGVVGLGLAALGAQGLRAVLHVPPLDPLSYAGAALLLGAAAAVALGLPARRAASVDPLVALRQE